MVKGERITISADTKDNLAKIAKPFEKFDDCIKRVLECSCIEKEIKSEQKPTESEQ